MESIHQLNIVIHVLAGIVALVAGLTAIFIRKTSKRHKQYGRLFMWMIVIVITTGLIGVFVFKRNNFLLVITLLSGYTCYSGIRSVRLGGQRPASIDHSIALLVIAAACYYLYYIRSTGLYWSPVIIYSTMGALFIVTIYDLFKLFLPPATLKMMVMYEHTYKMISALSAIASAFTGTIFPGFKPFSQFLPSVIGLACIFITFIMLNNKKIMLKKTNSQEHN